MRSLLVWLLVLGLCAQGAAAATMAFCGAHHHGGGSASALHATAPPHHGHGHGEGAAHAHHHAGPLADADLSALASQATDSVGDASTHKCSACASCCAGGAILSAVLYVPTPVLACAVFSAVVPSVDSFAPSGPDRPPRIGPA